MNNRRMTHDQWRAAGSPLAINRPEAPREEAPKTFAEMKPAERARFATTNPKAFRVAREAWTTEVQATTEQLKGSTNVAERRALNARLAELTAHGVPSSAA